MKKGATRLDVALVERGLSPSREKAQAQIMAGLVYVGEEKAAKPSQQVIEGDDLSVRGTPHPYVSRGALKLEKALSVFPVDPQERIAVDVGASTGGFTDLLLRRGAQCVFAVDVGYGQLDWRLRSDPRVMVMERTNARYLTPESMNPRPDLAVMDVSFISIEKILPALLEILPEVGQCISLIKPQFEAGREHVGKKGVVRDSAVHEMVLRRVTHAAQTIGFQVRGLDFSPITGPEGNIEFLLYCAKGDKTQEGGEDWEISQVVQNAHESLRHGEETVG